MNNLINTGSNKIWETSENYTDFENTRPILFRDDMREQFFRWFHIKPDSKVLDGGCATGIVAGQKQ